MEKNIDEYIENIMIVFRECVRVIKNTGSVVFNMGDLTRKLFLSTVTTVYSCLYKKPDC